MSRTETPFGAAINVSGRGDVLVNDGMRVEWERGVTEEELERELNFDKSRHPHGVVDFNTWVFSASANRVQRVSWAHTAWKPTFFR